MKEKHFVTYDQTRRGTHKRARRYSRRCVFFPCIPPVPVPCTSRICAA